MLKIMKGPVWGVISASSRLTSQGGSHRSYLHGRQWTLPALSINGQHGWTFSARVRLPPIKCDRKWLLLLKPPSQRPDPPIQISMKTICQTKPQSMYNRAASQLMRCWAFFNGQDTFGTPNSSGQKWKWWNLNGLWYHTLVSMFILTFQWFTSQIILNNLCNV